MKSMALYGRRRVRNSITMGLSVGVLILVLIYSVKIKGLGGWLYELISSPFGLKP